MPAKPTHASPTSPRTDVTAAHVGAEMLGLPLTPQGERVARLLEHRRGQGVRYQTVVVQMPRRAAKTTSVWSTLIGRAVLRPGYRCVATAQSGTIASTIILEYGGILEARGHREAGLLRLYRNQGRERIEFENGSRIWVVPPAEGAVRSAAADDIVIDEAGEHDARKGVDFLNAVRPLQDTRGPLAQLIVTGTPGRARAGMFWDLLEQGRTGSDRDQGILDYSASDDDDPDDERVWKRVHPGIGTLTTLRTIRKRRGSMDVAAFSREYLCLWPPDLSTSAINQAKWQTSEVPQLPIPERVGLAFDVALDGTSAALCAAWRDEDGTAYVGVVECRQGVQWLTSVAHRVAKKYRQPLRYDAIGANHGPAEEIARLRGVQLAGGSGRDAQGAAQRLVSELAEGRLRHFGQASLTAAAQGAAWRQSEGGRYFARKASASDVAPLVAASLALWQFDQTPARQPLHIVSTVGRAS